MKNTKLKLFPLFIMLVAGSITSIMTFYFQYEIKTAILVLLSVLLVFYLLGLLLVNVIASFDKAIAKEEQERKQAEGQVLEKEEVQEGAEPEEETPQPEEAME